VNLDELTLGQVKQLQNIFGGHKDCPPYPHLGKKCIIRTYSAGVHYGILQSKNGDEVELNEAIRIWQWYGACSLSQLAMEGTKDPDQCKFSVPVKQITLLGVIEIIPCSDKAIANIESVPTWKK
jgi:hypothetical protein